MADLAQLERALVNADAAGDAEAAKAFAGEIRRLRAASPAAPNQDHGILKNVILGGVKGASDIGATIVSPLDRLGITGMTPDQRREQLKQFFTENANPDSASFKVGEIGTQVAGTAGAGGALGKLAQVAGATPKVVAALESGGLTLGGNPATTVAGKVGDMALRSGAGAVTGTTMAGMVNPDDAKSGAIVGAALPPSLKAAGAIGKAVGSTAKGAIGATTGVGGEAINNAIQAGKSGNTAFLDNLRGNVPMTDVLADAKDALAAMRQARAAEYRSNMAGVAADKTTLDMQPILDAVNNQSRMGSYKGQVVRKNAVATVDDIKQTVENWAQLNPAEYHTPEGLDALKQAVGDIRDATQFGTPGRKAADSVYNAIKNQITQQAPEYAKAMKSYSEASELISEIERALSMNERASADTAMRKLQSLMRNNVQTNYGNRLDLAKQLEAQGGKDILPAVAGQAMNSWMPRGMIGQIEKGGGLLGMAMNPAAIPHIIAAAPMTSPRLMGEALYGVGRVAGSAGNAAQKTIANPKLSAMIQALRSPSGQALPAATINRLLVAP